MPGPVNPDGSPVTDGDFDKNTPTPVDPTDGLATGQNPTGGGPSGGPSGGTTSAPPSGAQGNPSSGAQGGTPPAPPTPVDDIDSVSDKLTRIEAKIDKILSSLAG